MLIIGVCKWGPTELLRTILGLNRPAKSHFKEEVKK